MTHEAKASTRPNLHATQAPLSVDTAPRDDEVSPRTSAKQSATSSTTPTSATSGSSSLVRDALKPNLSAVEATSQLKVLCRKFAALTEKVKDETRTREEAEKEVRRLRAIVEGNDAPVVASYRTESQAYIRELKDAQEALKHELRDEKTKNAKLVSKALELEKEKSSLLAAASSASQMRAKELQPSISDRATVHSSRQTTGWDREQATKIHDTLRTTIDELQDELARKEEELDSYRERLQRERTRVKALETELRECEESSREEHSVLKELEVSIHEQREQFEAIEKEMQSTEQRLAEEATMRTTLEQQIETLNDVNAALEQRTKALVRRIELSQSLADEMDDLKLQLRDAEVDKETLVRSIKDVKDQHYIKETQWKAQVEQLRSEKLVVAAQTSDLQTEITSLRTQNSLYSEWMLVRSENIAVAQQQQKQHQQHQQQTSDGRDDVEEEHQQRGNKPHRPHHDRDHEPNASRVRPLPPRDYDNGIYAHVSTRCPLSPSKTRSMTTASPIKQSWLGAIRRSSVSSSASSSEESEKWDSRPASRRAPTSKPMAKTHAATRGAATTSLCTSKLSDHERLRELMSRNRELQTRLQQETLATRNLEQEITHIASQRRQTNLERTESA